MRGRGAGGGGMAAGWSNPDKAPVAALIKWVFKRSQAPRSPRLRRNQSSTQPRQPGEAGWYSRSRAVPSCMAGRGQHAGWGGAQRGSAPGTPRATQRHGCLCRPELTLAERQDGTRANITRANPISLTLHRITAQHSVERPHGSGVGLGALQPMQCNRGPRHHARQCARLCWAHVVWGSSSASSRYATTSETSASWLACCAGAAVLVAATRCQTTSCPNSSVMAPSWSVTLSSRRDMTGAAGVSSPALRPCHTALLAEPSVRLLRDKRDTLVPAYVSRGHLSPPSRERALSLPSALHLQHLRRSCRTRLDDQFMHEQACRSGRNGDSDPDPAAASAAPVRDT